VLAAHGKEVPRRTPAAFDPFRRLGIERVEFLFQPFFGGFPCIDRAAQASGQRNVLTAFLHVIAPSAPRRRAG
jgi:hypothetical protein